MAEALRSVAWTPPHHGVTHLEGVQRGFQATVTRRGSHWEVYLIRTDTFQTIEHKFCASEMLAKNIAEKWVTERSLWT